MRAYTSEKLKTVQTIIDAWKRADIEAVLEQLDEDVEYHTLVGQRPLQGKVWVRRFLEKFGDGQTDIRWQICNHAENGDLLLVEGVDDYVDAQGRRVQTPYMGAFEFRGGKIYKWRDYLDSALLAGVERGEPLPEWTEAFIKEQLA